MRTVPATKPHRHLTTRALGFWLLSLTITLITLVGFTRAPLMPRSLNQQPPMTSVALTGTVFARLNQSTPLILNKQGFSLELKDALGNPLSLQFEALEEASQFDLSSELNSLSVNLMQDQTTYLSFKAYMGELSVQDNVLIINALLESPNGQPLNLNARLELGL